jgi:hypothetical protein
MILNSQTTFLQKNHGLLGKKYQPIIRKINILYLQFSKNYHFLLVIISDLKNKLTLKKYNIIQRRRIMLKFMD